MGTPIVVDIDGTMSRADRSIEGSVFDALRAWDGEVVIATGKAFPYPVSLCDYIGIDIRVIAENGGVVCVEDEVSIAGEPERARQVEADLLAAGYDLGWDETDLINRWRETELAVRRHVPLNELDEIAARNELEVVDSGFAYHVKSPTVSKGNGLDVVADLVERQPSEFVAIGDSANDVSTFEVAGLSFAVANASDDAKAAADHVTAGSYADGLLEALDMIS